MKEGESSVQASSAKRTPRAERTRVAVVDALLALIHDGDPKPSARQVADRAGVSIRTVFSHFASLEDLYRASAERVAVSVLSLMTPIDPDQPLTARIESLCRQRALVNEKIGPVRRAAAMQAASSAALAEARDLGRRASFQQLDRVFADVLGRLDDSTRGRCRATIDALLSGEAWDLLRTTHGLSYEAASVALAESVSTLLGAVPPAIEPELTPRPDAEKSSRARAAAQTLADVDQRIERLVAAVEIGLPADVVAPRLAELRAARLTADRELAGAHTTNSTADPDAER